MSVDGYRKFPPSPPDRRNVWLLVCFVLVALVANLAHQGGIW